jgi:hypothetical protein
MRATLLMLAMANASSPSDAVTGRSGSGSNVSTTVGCGIVDGGGGAFRAASSRMAASAEYGTGTMGVGAT